MSHWCFLAETLMLLLGCEAACIAGRWVELACDLAAPGESDILRENVAHHFAGQVDILSSFRVTSVVELVIARRIARM